MIVYPFYAHYNIECLCVPLIGANLEIFIITKFAKVIKQAGIRTVHNFNNCQKGQVGGFEFFGGSRDWHVVKKLKSGVAGEADEKMIYYETSDGFMLIGSVDLIDLL